MRKIEATTEVSRGRRRVGDKLRQDGGLAAIGAIGHRRAARGVGRGRSGRGTERERRAVQ